MSSAIYTPTNTVHRAVLESLRQQSNDNLLTDRPIADAIHCSSIANTLIVGPAVGAPAAALMITGLHRRGIKRLILLGTSGALISKSSSSEDPQPEIGDFVLPSAALPEDGVSLTYLQGASDVFAVTPNDWQQKLNDAVSDLKPTHIAPVWTTDTPMLETADKVKHFYHRGARFVEMEYAPLLLLSRKLAIEFGALFVVSDTLGECAKSGLKSQELRQAISVAASQLVKFTLVDSNNTMG